jgi:hypothetical protein
MKKAIGALGLAFFLAGCSAVAAVPPSPSPPPVAVSAAPTVTTSPPPASAPVAPPPAYGVLVDLLTTPSIYSANVVGVDARLWASIKLEKRTPIANEAGHAIVLPYVSTSSTALYMLDGDSTVWSLRLPDGKQAVAARIPLGPGQEAAFAVSPDDSKIAVSVLDFNRSPVHVWLYTDNLGGGDQHVIYESDSNYVWPVAWHSGLLVLAHAYGPYEEDVAKAAPGRDNPYSAVSYHIVDPITGDRVFLLGGCTVSGPLSPAGSGCIQGGTIDWQGNASPPWGTRDWGAVSSAAALSPDGLWVAAATPDAPDEMGTWMPDGRLLGWVDGAGIRDWAGWIDDQHILTGSYLNAGFQPTESNAIKDSLVLTVSAHGFYAATLPTDIV